jgi:hypothetical protein
MLHRNTGRRVHEASRRTRRESVAATAVPIHAAMRRRGIDAVRAGAAPVVAVHYTVGPIAPYIDPIQGWGYP